MARVTAKGQVTIPFTVRRSLHLAEGDDLLFRLVPEGAFVQVRKRARLVDFFGALPADGPPPDKATVRDEVGKALGRRRQVRDRLRA